MTPRLTYVLAGLTVLAGAAVLSSIRVLMILGGLPLALLLPGAALTALLFRDRERLVTLERILLIPLLSLATLVLGGILVWAAGAPLHRVTWLALTAGVTLAGLAVVRTRELQTPAVPAEQSTPALADVGAEESQPEPIDRGRRLIRQVVPGALSVLLLGGAVWLSLVSARHQGDGTVTTLSVAPPAAATSSGSAAERSVQVSASGLSAGADAYQLVVTTATGTGGTSVAVTADRQGAWSSTLRLPAADRLTLVLRRAGETAALRTVIVAAEATG